MSHKCLWPAGCEKDVDDAIAFCKGHYFATPLFLRRRMFAVYYPGRPVDAQSPRFHAGIKDLDKWIKQREKEKSKP